MREWQFTLTSQMLLRQMRVMATMMHRRRTSQRSLWRFAAACSLLAAHAFSGPLQAQMATEDRLLYRGWWPRHSTPSADEYVGPAECAKCHAGKMAAQRNTPMARTSAPVTDSGVLATHSKLTFQTGRISYQIAAAERKKVYTITSDTH